MPSRAELPALRVAWADEKAARFACTRWHYSKSVPPGVNNVVGVWEGADFVGVIMFARGASPKLGERFGLGQTECCELVRVALRRHAHPVTRMLKFACKLLKRRNPGLRLVVSFADTYEGHHGGIYQGAGWIYTGQSAPSKGFIDASGRRWHNRQVSASGWIVEFGQKRRCPKKSDVRPILLPGKHRYLLPLDDAMRKKLAPLGLPYPKRKVAADEAARDTRACAGSADSGTRSLQLRGEGATPIPALHDDAHDDDDDSASSAELDDEHDASVA